MTLPPLNAAAVIGHIDDFAGPEEDTKPYPHMTDEELNAPWRRRLNENGPIATSDRPTKPIRNQNRR